MGLYYANQQPNVVIGTKSETTPTAITLESTYQTESGNTKQVGEAICAFTAKHHNSSL